MLKVQKFTGTRFCTATTAELTPFTPTAVKFVEFIALKAYSKMKGKEMILH